MIRATSILRAGTWRGPAAQSVTLDYGRRFRRRLRLTTAQGGEVLLDLPEAQHIHEGDALALDEGGLVLVHAAAEDLLEITVPGADALARLAWHLGNRHLSVQFLPGVLRILDDHVIAAMVEQLGGQVRRLTAPFDPEPGAYDHG